MQSLAGCCVHNVASQASTPYQRLHKRTAGSRSDSSIDAALAEDGSSAVAMAHQKQHNHSHPAVMNKKHSLNLNGQRHISLPEKSSNASCDGDDHNTVLLKISILGDAETGKTSFLAKYCGVEVKEEGESSRRGGSGEVSSMEKLFKLQNVTLLLRIWDLKGHWHYASMLPMLCRDSVAVFIMFDLTRRSTLHSVKEWFLKAQEWNKGAMPVIIGTKYDRFVQMPQDMQRAIYEEARAYAQAMGASLFFSSVTHNINVKKIFKVVVAKLFDLPCKISRNVNLGEPIIEY